MEYFLGEEKLAEFHVQSEDLESLHPLIHKLKQSKIDFEYEVIEGYGHNALAVFQNYITQKAQFLVLHRDPRMYVKSVQLALEPNGNLICHVHYDQAESIEFAYYWYRNKECIDKQFYVKRKANAQADTNGVKGNYEVNVFVKLNATIIKLISGFTSFKIVLFFLTVNTFQFPLY